LSTNRYSDDDFERFEFRFNPLVNDRKARRGRKPRANPRDQKVSTSPRDVLDDLADAGEGLEGGFKTTYKPARFEEGWLLDSLRPFYDQGLITDVLSLVKGGKEASVYCCAADPETGYEIVAAKVYRPRALRNLRNDVMYREGREYLGDQGMTHNAKNVSGTVHSGAKREMRAIEKKTSFGVKLQHGSWLSYEYTTLKLLSDAGASVPAPISIGENAILMEYVGDEDTAAPPLSQINLDRDERLPLFEDVIYNIELMLKAGWIHGDLSAYNILYWDGDITFIDFPQVTSAHANRSAKFILSRDVQRVCEYFIKQGVRCDPRVISERLWNTYVETFPNMRAAELSNTDPVEDEE